MRMFLVAYDISDKKRLRKVAKLVYSHALCGQKSALHVLFDKEELEEFVKKILDLTKAEDKVNIIPIQGEPLVFNKTECVAFDKGAVIT